MGTEPKKWHKKGTQMVGIVWSFQQLIYYKGDLVINNLTNEQCVIRDVMGSERGFILLFLQSEDDGFRECDACDKSMVWHSMAQNRFKVLLLYKNKKWLV